MSNYTKALGNYIKERGVSLTAVSNGSNVSYSKLQPSFKGKRELRADEFFSVCGFLGISPNIFINNS